MEILHRSTSWLGRYPFKVEIRGLFPYGVGFVIEAFVGWCGKESNVTLRSWFEPAYHIYYPDRLHSLIGENNELLTRRCGFDSYAICYFQMDS